MFKGLILIAAVVNGQYYNDKQQKTLRAYWPEGVTFPENGKFYEMKAAYQDWEGALPGVHSPEYNISAVRGEPFGNANKEFPWKVTAGLDKAEGWQAWTMISIPEGKNIKWWKERSYGGRNSYRWRFPDGTQVAEMLLVRGDDEEDRCFEVRMRTRGPNGWEPTVFRPIADAKVLNWTQKKVVSVDRHTVVADTKLHVIPKMDPKMWLSLPFQESRIQMTTERTGGIVPKGYRGNVTNCMSCHGTVGMHAREFDAARDWYGEVRGGDTVFSFHIFDESSISNNGFGRPVRFNKNLPLEHWAE